MSIPNVVVTPNINRVLENVNAAMLLLTKRLAPAKMKVEGAEGLKNSGYFKMWSIAKRMSFSGLTAEQIAEEFYHAVQADCEQFPQSQLVWETPPKALTKRAKEATNRPAKVADSREASSFEEKSHAADEALKQQKIQEAAKKTCQELVQRFCPIDHRRGSVKFELRESHQKDWNARIEKAKDFTKLETEIRNEQREIYAKLERSAEKL